MNDEFDNAMTDKEMLEKFQSFAYGDPRACGAEETASYGVWDCNLPRGHGGDYHETHSKKTGKVIHRWRMR